MGTSCTNLASASDFDTLVQCTSSTATSGTQQTAPHILGTVTAPPYAAVTCDASKAGMLQWTGTNFQACDGTTWSVFAGAVNASSNPFSFTNQTGVSFSKTIISNVVALSGFSGQLLATCNTGCTGIFRNGAFVGMSAYFWPGDTIAIQLTSAPTALTATTASVTVGTTTSGTWMVTTGPAADACAGAPPAGTICADGTIYVGLSPDGAVRMYAAPCDAGMSWNGLSCIGSRTGLTWDDGKNNSVPTGFISTVTGRANTTGLAAFGESPSPAPYNAARYCDGLILNGYSDWYLPASGELNMVMVIAYNGTANGFTAGWYWSSTESNTGLTSMAAGSNNGLTGSASRTFGYNVRCVRR
ncbi:MAG: DUF1566 domain-containing protein [Alphaproteobacteria bacterium]|nr:DUF1566 domain-containing protein [Alphaproteobacteria bacterium]